MLRRGWNALLLSGLRPVKRGLAKGCCRFYDGDEAKLTDRFRRDSHGARVLAYVIIIFVFGMPLDEMEEFGQYAVPILLGMGNVVFFVYDIALTRVIGAYLHRWRKAFRRLFK